MPLTLNVIYAFGGFISPVASPPALNVQRGGQTVPVKFTLDALLADVKSPGFPASRQVDCTTRAPIGPLEPTDGTARVDLDTQIYSWRTDREWNGTCRELVLRLNDNTEHNAFFEFRP